MQYQHKVIHTYYTKVEEDIKQWGDSGYRIVSILPGYLPDYLLVVMEREVI